MAAVVALDVGDQQTITFGHAPEALEAAAVLLIARAQLPLRCTEAHCDQSIVKRLVVGVT